MAAADDGMQLDDGGGAVARQPVRGALDVEALATRYAGFGRVQRLVYIAQRSAELRVRALELAVHTLKTETTNTTLYRELCTEAGQALGPAYRFDAVWAEQTERACELKQQAMEKDLNILTNNQVRESIRRGFVDLAAFMTERGDFSAAIRAWIRAREFCGSNKQTAETCFAVLELALLSSQFALVAPNASRLESTTDASMPSVASKVHAAVGIVAMRERSYRSAALAFLDVSPTLGDTFNAVVHVEEVAAYAALTSLATFSRDELKARVINSSSAKMLLEYVPLLRDVIYDVYASRYASALELLASIKPTLALDMHLGPHVDTLHRLVRAKALGQYLSPYTAVDLRAMAAAFRVDVGSLEREVAALISAGDVNGRIDSYNKVFHARVADARDDALQRVHELGAQYAQEARLLLLRASMERQGLVTKGAGGVADGASSWHTPIGADGDEFVDVDGGLRGDQPENISVLIPNSMLRAASSGGTGRGDLLGGRSSAFGAPAGAGGSPYRGAPGDGSTPRVGDGGSVAVGAAGVGCQHWQRGSWQASVSVRRQRW